MRNTFCDMDSWRAFWQHLLPFESTFVFFTVKIGVFWGNFGKFVQNREFNAMTWLFFELLSMSEV